MIGIVWRSDSHRDEFDRSGAIWDHVQLQRILAPLRCRFVVIGYDEHSTRSERRRTVPTDDDLVMLNTALKAAGLGHVAPAIPITDEEAMTAVDVVVLTGVSQAGESDEDRKRAHQLVVGTYLGRKPILAICGALYWLDGVRGLKLEEVKSHSWSSMIDYSMDKKKSPFTPKNNVQVHNVNFTAESRSILFHGVPPAEVPLTMSVNSVHNRGFKRLPPDTVDTSFTVLAKSGDAIPMADGTKRNMRGNDMDPEKGVIEAFAIRQSGKLLVAVQWHPEAYFPASQPGDDYQNKMLLATVGLLLTNSRDRTVARPASAAAAEVDGDAAAEATPTPARAVARRGTSPTPTEPTATRPVGSPSSPRTQAASPASAAGSPVRATNTKLTWNEFQAAHKGMYDKRGLSDAYKAYKEANGDR